MKESGMKAVLLWLSRNGRSTGLKALMDAGFTVSALFTHADPASGAQFYGFRRPPGLSATTSRFYHRGCQYRRMASPHSQP
ncbi:hypothetical protein WDV93_22200 [Pantoea ananatis]